MLTPVPGPASPVRPIIEVCYLVAQELSPEQSVDEWLNALRHQFTGRGLHVMPTDLPGLNMVIAERVGFSLIPGKTIDPNIREQLHRTMEDPKAPLIALLMTRDTNPTLARINRPRPFPSLRKSYR